MQRAAGRRLFDASKDKWADMKRAYGRCKIFKMHGETMRGSLGPRDSISIVYRHVRVREKNFIHVFFNKFLREFLNTRGIFFFFFYDSSETFPIVEHRICLNNVESIC